MGPNRAVALLLAAALAPPVAAQQATITLTPLFEKPPTIAASDLLLPEMLRGPRFTVAERVPTDGWTARFTLAVGLRAVRGRGHGAPADADRRARRDRDARRDQQDVGVRRVREEGGGEAGARGEGGRRRAGRDREVAAVGRRAVLRAHVPEGPQGRAEREGREGRRGRAGAGRGRPGRAGARRGREHGAAGRRRREGPVRLERRAPSVGAAAADRPLHDEPGARPGSSTTWPGPRSRAASRSAW